MNTTQTHTPGTWTIHQENIDPEWHIITAPGGRITANVHIETGNAQDEANARLIAAAPELLKALKATMKALDELDSATGHHAGETLIRLIEKANTLYGDALAKAEGRHDHADL